MKYFATLLMLLGVTLFAIGCQPQQPAGGGGGEAPAVDAPAEDAAPAEGEEAVEGEEASDAPAEDEAAEGEVEAPAPADEAPADPPEEPEL